MAAKSRIMTPANLSSSDRDQISQSPDRKRYHLIGIGGIGMSSLARMLLARGAIVTGSDRSEGEIMDTLRREGAVVSVGHDSANLPGSTGPGTPDVVVYSRAVPDENPELQEARRRGIRIIHRAELLAELMANRTALCVCGTHGKTTTTAMLTAILEAVGQDPSMMLGGICEPLGGNVRVGQGPVFVAEACEAYGSFLSLAPQIAVVTNIEPDHLDEQTTFEDLRSSFQQFLGRVPESGLVIACIDSPEVETLLPTLRGRVETYSLQSEKADWRAVSLGGGRTEVLFRGEPIATFQLRIPGEHNVVNALAAMAAARAVGVRPMDAALALERFSGVDRRFSIRGAAGGVLLIDDYAHHPSEITVNLEAIRAILGGRVPVPASFPAEFQFHRSARIIVAFQPHLYSRTSLFMEEFARALALADRVVVAEIYAARESPLSGVTGERLATEVRKVNPACQVEFAPDFEALTRAVAHEAKPGDIALTMGAGDITDAGPLILEALKKISGRNDMTLRERLAGVNASPGQRLENR